MSGPRPEQTHEPAPASPAERIAVIIEHRRPRLPSAEATFQGMLDDGVIAAGPTVLTGIEEANPVEDKAPTHGLDTWDF
ncbi:MAG TPA: hypothetical protein VF506_06425 [Streptosporangiaceae bacterium]